VPSYKQRKKGGQNFPGFTSTDNSEVSSSAQDTSHEADDIRRIQAYKTSPYALFSSCSVEPGTSQANRRYMYLNGEKCSESSMEKQKQSFSNPEVMRIKRELVELESNRKRTMRIIKKLKNKADDKRQVF